MKTHGKEEDVEVASPCEGAHPRAVLPMRFEGRFPCASFCGSCCVFKQAKLLSFMKLQNCRIASC